MRQSTTGYLVYVGASLVSCKSKHPVDQYPVPSFENADKGPKRTLDGDVTCFSVTTSSNEENAGVAMQMRIYMPKSDGQTAPASLPVVLVPPAGTNLMVGNSLDDSNYHDETLPYAQAGMIAVAYSLDGQCDLQQAQDQELREAYLKFRAACGGVVNGRNALEYVLSTIPEANPNRIYAAGHSSAANVSLLLAAHEPRIKACIAYCPAADVEAELAEVINDSGANLLLPKLAEFLKQSNPMTHAGRFKCPLLVVHARNDQNTPFINTDRFVTRLKAEGANVTFRPVPTGGHYDSMIAAIHGAIEWLRSER